MRGARLGDEHIATIRGGVDGDVRVRVPGVHHHGQLELRAERQVGLEERALHRSGRVVVVVVQPGLAQGHHRVRE